MSTLSPKEVHIHDGNWQQFVKNPVVEGETKARGLVPRNYDTHPRGCYAKGLAIDFPLIPRSEWPDRIKDMEANKSRLSDIRGAIPSRDQNGKGYCWAHSTVSAAILLRARDNQPYVSLSAYAVACIIKSYRDEGGWGAESVDWVIQNGIPSEQFWPQQSMSSKNDNPAMRANAKLHRISEEWMDLAVAQYDRNLTFDQCGTLLLSRVPGPFDYNWWSHSVCGTDLVNGNAEKGTFRMASGKLATLGEFDFIWGVNTEAGGFGVRIWNSWGDSWSDRGMGVLSGKKAIPDGAVGLRVIQASAA